MPFKKHRPARIIGDQPGGVFLRILNGMVMKTIDRHIVKALACKTNLTLVRVNGQGIFDVRHIDPSEPHSMAYTISSFLKC